MKTKLISLALLLAAPSWLQAAPVTYDEISLLVRMHESASYIAQQVAARRLVRPLTATQEATLQAQGASAAFLATLRNPNTTLSEAEAEAFDTRRASQRKAVLDALAADVERERTRLALGAQTREQEAEAARERLAAEAARQGPAAVAKRPVRAPYPEVSFVDPFPFVPGGTVVAAPASRIPVQRLGNTLFNVNGEVIPPSGSQPSAPNSGVVNGTVPPKPAPIPSGSSGATAPRGGNGQARSAGPTNPASGNSNRH